jgi:O-antigen/teichoic acid export membrane protein
MNLRNTAVRGGFYLVLRQALGILISILGLILLTRALGPGAYGIWVAAIGVYNYFSALSGWGVNVYLIRREGEPSAEDYHQAFSVLLLLGLVGAVLALLALPLIQHWIRLEAFGSVAVALFAGLPVNLVASVPLARLERALSYRKVALIELSGLAVFYPIALPLAYQGAGPWAPVAGWWTAQLLSLGLLYRVSDYRPRLHWEGARVRTMVRYGLGFSASEWIWNLGNLVNPLVVGRYAGVEAVGQVGLAIRLVEQLSSIVLLPVGRLSIPLFARVREDKARLVKALAEGTTLQIVALGPILAGSGLIAFWLIPLLLGPEWLPALEVYPFIAAAYLAGGATSLHSSILLVLRRLRQVAIFRLTHLFFFTGSALILVPYLGIIGYGWADLVAIPSYTMLLIWVLKYVGRPISFQALVWFVSWIPPLFSWQLGQWTWISLIAPLAWPAARKELLRAVAMALRILRRTNAQS